jgi:hypothetical protein
MRILAERQENASRRIKPCYPGRLWPDLHMQTKSTNPRKLAGYVVYPVHHCEPMPPCRCLTQLVFLSSVACTQKGQFSLPDIITQGTGVVPQLSSAESWGFESGTRYLGNRTALAILCSQRVPRFLTGWLITEQRCLPIRSSCERADLSQSLVSLSGRKIV